MSIFKKRKSQINIYINIWDYLNWNFIMACMASLCTESYTVVECTRLRESYMNPMCHVTCKRSSVPMVLPTTYSIDSSYRKLSSDSESNSMEYYLYMN